MTNKLLLGYIVGAVIWFAFRWYPYEIRNVENQMILEQAVTLGAVFAIMWPIAMIITEPARLATRIKNRGVQ